MINYISKGCIPQDYWVNTGRNGVLEDVLKTAADDISGRFYALLQGDGAARILKLGIAFSGKKVRIKAE